SRGAGENDYIDLDSGRDSIVHEVSSQAPASSSIIYVDSADASDRETKTARFSSENVSTIALDSAVDANNVSQDSNRNNALAGTLDKDPLLGIGAIDDLEGDTDIDQFVLKNAKGGFYTQSGWNGSACIKSCKSQPDQLMLTGSIDNYTIKSKGQCDFPYLQCSPHRKSFLPYLNRHTNVGLRAVRYEL
ncbi:MAG: hypothetical protein AAFY72_11830, partial [Cyanobacteria bacterium J06649_4]